MELKYLNRFLYWALESIFEGEFRALPVLCLAAASVAREETEMANEEYLRQVYTGR